MKQSFTNPIAMARNAIGAVTLMSLINVLLVFFQLPPIMPLSLTLPVSYSAVAFSTSEYLQEIYPDPAQLANVRTASIVWVVAILAILAFTFWRMSKKPKAVILGIAVVGVDTLALLLFYPILSFSFVVELLYHGLVLYYLYKGYKAIKQEQAHV